MKFENEGKIFLLMKWEKKKNNRKINSTCTLWLMRWQKNRIFQTPFNKMSVSKIGNWLNIAESELLKNSRKIDNFFHAIFFTLLLDKILKMQKIPPSKQYSLVNILHFWPLYCPHFISPNIYPLNSLESTILTTKTRITLKVCQHGARSDMHIVWIMMAINN